MFVFLLFVYCISASTCGVTPTVNSKFDDVAVSDADVYIALPRPYNGVVYRRVNTPFTSYPDDHIPVMNVSNPSIPWYFAAGAVSMPNLIFTTGESMSIRKSDDGTFAIISLQMKAIYIDQMAIFVNTSRLGVVISSTVLNLAYDVPTLVTINQKGIDEVLIGCVNPDFITCAHMTYDNVKLCRL